MNVVQVNGNDLHLIDGTVLLVWFMRAPLQL